MANSAAQSSLTEKSIADLDREFTKQTGESSRSWAEKVVGDERIHLFYSTLGQNYQEGEGEWTTTAGPISGPEEGSTLRNIKQQPDQSHLNATLKLFIRYGDTAFPEGPLERFLTPDGCSDPPYFVRPLLDNEFGSAGSIEERQQQARNNTERAKHTKDMSELSEVGAKKGKSN
ncbi:hypothetical protein V8E54_007839 [Elaphomyces granulatus]